MDAAAQLQQLQGADAAAEAEAAVALVEYEAAHVATYCRWLADPWVREMTKTEGGAPGEAEVEATRRRWADDPNALVWLLRERASGRLAGDVNVFVRGQTGEAEVGVMVAEAACRRKGLASAGVRLAMARAARSHGVRRFVAQVSADNAASLALFGRLGYRRERDLPEFGEVVMAWGDEPAAAAASEEEEQEQQERDWAAVWAERAGLGAVPSDAAGLAGLAAAAREWLAASQAKRRANLTRLVDKAAASGSKAEPALRRRLRNLDATFGDESAALEANLAADPRFC